VDISFQPRSVGHMITWSHDPRSLSLSLSNPVSLSLSPPQVWGPRQTTSELLARKGRRREGLTSQVDLEDLIYPLTLTPPPQDLGPEPKHGLDRNTD